MYGRRIWSAVLTEQRRLKVFQKRALTGMSRPKGQNVRGGQIKIRHEELHKFLLQELQLQSLSSPGVLNIVCKPSGRHTITKT